MAETLEDLVNRCTVRIVVPATDEQGTGFFVAPGLVVTCAHVVKGVAPGTPVQLSWRAQQEQPFQDLRAQVRLRAEAQDLALLAVETPLDHPCVWLAEARVATAEKLYSFGYPMHLGADGTAVLFTCEGWTERDEQTLLTLTDGQIVPGMSGAPVLSRQTGQVCGILAITRDQGSNLGGRAILIRTLWQVAPVLQDAQATWKQQDQRWRTSLEAHRRALAPSSPSAESPVGPARRPKDYLPLQPTALFQERPGEFAKLEQLLFGQEPPARVGLVRVVGLGGVGKTSLAVEIATRYREHFPAGIFWMPATGQTRYDWQQHLAELARQTEYLPPEDNPAQPENEERRAKHVARYLAEHPGALLILDNVEHPELVGTALPAIAGLPLTCTLLYTSRKQEAPDGVSTHLVELLRPEEALRLLLEASRPAVLAEAGAGGHSTEVQAARALCQQVGFLPLGLVHLRRQLARTPTLTVARLAEEVRKRGALAIATHEYEDVRSLFATFAYSWEQLDPRRDADARRLFYLASFFPEANPIPLWLLGLAAGLGEQADPWEPLGQACQALYEVSLLELLAEGQVRLHPLVREFARGLVAAWRDQGQGLAALAGERLVAELTNLTRLEQRARREGYWGCLEQVQAAASYAARIGADQGGRLARLERWLSRESDLLGLELWPERVPGLLYQQLANRAVEEGQPAPEGEVPAQWVRQLKPVGAEDQSLLRIFRGHSSTVNSVAFSPNGKQVLTSSLDGTTRIWEAVSGRLLVTIGVKNSSTFVGYNPDGEAVILLNGTGEINSVAFSPNGQQVLTGSGDGTARLWEAASGRELARLSHQSEVRSVAFSPDGQQVLTGSFGGIVRLWEATSSQLLATLETQGPMYSVAFSPDARRLLAGFWGGTAGVWEIASGQLLATLKGHQSEVRSMAFSPDGQLVLTGSEDGAARLWEIASGRQLTIVAGHQDEVHSVAFSPDGRQVLTGSDDGTARLWEVASGQELARLSHQSEVRSVAFSPDGRLVLTGSVKEAQVWETGSARLLATLAHPEPILRMAFSPDGKLVLTGSIDETARIWEAVSGRLLTTLEGHQLSVISVTFSPNGSQVLTGSIDLTARLWEAATGRELVRLSHQGAVSSLDFSPDGQQVLTGSGEGRARLWEAASGRLLVTLEDPDSVGLVAFSPDGQLVLSMESKTALVWEVASRRKLARLRHQEQLTNVAFAPDERLVVTCDVSGRVWYWEYRGSQAGRLAGVYPAAYKVEAIHRESAHCRRHASRTGHVPSAESTDPSRSVRDVSF